MTGLKGFWMAAVCAAWMMPAGLRAQAAPATAQAGPVVGAPLSQRDQRLLVDFADLERFKDANAALDAPAAGENRACSWATRLHRNGVWMSRFRGSLM